CSSEASLWSALRTSAHSAALRVIVSVFASPQLGFIAAPPRHCLRQRPANRVDGDESMRSASHSQEPRPDGSWYPRPNGEAKESCRCPARTEGRSSARQEPDRGVAVCPK